MTNKFNTAIISALILMLGVSSSLAAVYTFGSSNDGFAGFMTSSIDPTQESWSLQTDSVRYINDDPDGVNVGVMGGARNGSLLRAFTLDRSAGASYTIEGVVNLTDGYADDNNRVGIYLFGDSPEVLNDDEFGALGLIFNLDDGSADGPPGSNADDDLNWIVGINAEFLATTKRSTNGSVQYAQDLFGTELTLTADITFTNIAGTDSISLLGSLTDFNDVTTTVSTVVPAAEYTGDYFGFVTKARNRAILSNMSAPWTMDYKSFSVIPEPASMALIGLFTAGIWVKRRFFIA